MKSRCNPKSRCSTNLTPELAERVCGALRYRQGLAAVSHPSKGDTILVATRNPIAPLHIADDEWQLDVQDGGKPSQTVSLTNPIGGNIIPLLIERTFLAQIATRTDYWTLESPRIWYEANPFRVEDGIAAYYRYEIGTILVEDVGVGLAVDVSVAFFSANTLDYFFDSNVTPDENKRRNNLFQRLTLRQERQKGTLLYDNGRSRSKCYFESAPPGMTCATTGIMRIKGESYDSLLAYYQTTNPDLPVTADSLVVRVSFKGLEHPQPVAAERVRIRVMNDSLPQGLSDVNKIRPDKRREILEKFWSGLEPKPLGSVAPGISREFWRPKLESIVQFPMPSLTFGQGQILAAPESHSVEAYKGHFRQRLQYLKQAGCYHVPPSITRTLYVAHSKKLDAQAVKQLATDFAEEIKRLTGKPMTAELVPYDSVNDAVEQLRDVTNAGMVVFILNEEPDAYYEAEFHLSGWHIKRITEPTLREHYKYLKEGTQDKRKGVKTLEAGEKRWRGFVNLNALDVIQLLEVTPYRIDQAGPYEAQLIIDVGHDRRYFAVSLLVSREESKSPSFQLISHVQYKVEHEQEAINPRILADEILAVFDRLFSRFRRGFDPLKSLLIMRDGRIVRQESGGLDDTVTRLKEKDYLSADSRVDWVDVHKDSLKSIRIWEVDERAHANNPLLGIGIRLNQKMIVMATTGVPTLTQGTADPIVLVGNGRCPDVMDAARANFAGAQLNWSSPGVAQKLHIGMKRTDDDLKTRAAQEIRRLR